MRLRILPYALTVAKYDRLPERVEGFFSLSRTGVEISLVCETARVPEGAIAREDGWRAFVIDAKLDFALVGTMASLSSVLAEKGIALFALSTYDTDYIFVKQERFEAAVAALRDAEYEVI